MVCAVSALVSNCMVITAFIWTRQEIQCLPCLQLNYFCMIIVGVWKYCVYKNRYVGRALENALSRPTLFYSKTLIYYFHFYKKDYSTVSLVQTDCKKSSPNFRQFVHVAVWLSQTQCPTCLAKAVSCYSTAAFLRWISSQLKCKLRIFANRA